MRWDEVRQYCLVLTACLKNRGVFYHSEIYFSTAENRSEWSLDIEAEFLLQTLQFLSEIRRNGITAPVRECFSKAFAGLLPSTGWRLYYYVRRKQLWFSCESDEYQAVELPRSQNPAQQSQWKFTAANQSNLAWGNWVTCWHILPFEVIKNHTSENPLMTQQRSQRTEVIMRMNHALSSSVLAIINKIFRRFSPQCESLQSWSASWWCPKEGLLCIEPNTEQIVKWLIILYLEKKPKTMIYILLTQLGFSLLLVF